ncbi:MAG: hypothetical protein PWQ20_738 [Thermotogaceae bacterium]|jgi:glyoxylase-like metal-dependent hydrolase (beta-lactamase superfamily II)|nr:hypothetical protein [Thermotogaceae bacterium]MDN5337668.1 hypothetical protein [Thermotogaceae bacterium]
MEEIFPGVFVIINEKGGANLGFIIGKTGVVVIDTSLFVQKARELKDYINSITKRPIIAVINTHYHPDHSFGNAAFNCQIISHETTAEIMKNMSEEYIKNIVSKTDLADDFQKFSIKLPNMTFKKSKKIDLGDRLLEITHVGGHTEDSSVVFIKPFNVLFAGDFVVNDYHPEIVPDSDLKTWMKKLKQILKWNIDFVIPGHGSIGNKQSLVDMYDYLKKIQEVSKGIKNGKIDLILDEISRESNFSNRKFPELLIHALKILITSET